MRVKLSLLSREELYAMTKDELIVLVETLQKRLRDLVYDPPSKGITKITYKPPFMTDNNIGMGK